MTDTGKLTVGRITELRNEPLLCSQGGVPYNRRHIDHWRERAEKAEAALESLSAERADLIEQRNDEIVAREEAEIKVISLRSELTDAKHTMENLSRLVREGEAELAKAREALEATFEQLHEWIADAQEQNEQCDRDENKQAAREWICRRRAIESAVGLIANRFVALSPHERQEGKA